MSIATNTLKYTQYYSGSCLIKYEKDNFNNDIFITEVVVKEGKPFLRTTKNSTEIIEEHELGIIDNK